MSQPRPPASEIYWEPGGGRLQIKSRFAAESLQSKALIRSTFSEHEVPVLPRANFVHLGGASIMDRGKAALTHLVPEIVEARKRHDLVLGVGGGARERHTYALGVDLELPTGGLASVGWMICEQNAIMLFHLMAENRAIEVPYLHFEMLPVYLREGSIPIVMSTPRYFMWEEIPAQGRIPIHRPDTGAMLFAEVMTMRSLLYVKDVDGLYTDDPKKNPKAELIREISAAELIERNLPDLPIERSVLEILAHSRNRKDIRIVNGLVPGNVRRALDGEDVGTRIHQ